MKMEVKDYPLLLKLHHTHNHSIKSADALRYRPVTKEVEEKFLALFDENHSPSSAYQAYKDELADTHGDEYVKVSADRSIMPDYFMYSICLRNAGRRTSDPSTALIVIKEQLTKSTLITKNIMRRWRRLVKLMMEKRS